MKIRYLLAAVLVLGAGLTGVAQAAPSKPELPRPTGPYAIGQSVLDLRDGSRADPWVPAERRELMVSVWYPAKRPGSVPAPYVTPQESANMLALLGLNDVPTDSLAKVPTHSTVDAPPLGRRAPLVVLSPGFMVSRTTLTTQAEDLASRGYVVAGIDHNYESNGITFADGHTTTCVACASTDRVKLVDNRAQDVSFVLDRLTGPNPVWGGGKLIDASRVAMVGHSIGGASTATAMAADRRIDAGVMLDGGYYTPVHLDRPFLQFGETEHAPGGADPTWDAGWQGLTGPKRWLTMDGEHFMSTDATLLATQLGFVADPPVDSRRLLVVSRAYIGAFVDQFLRGGSPALLSGPSPRYPEVRFWHP